MVARLIVEVRSDGTTTIARGALEDHEAGIQVGLEASGDTPMALAASLAGSMLKLPLLGLIGLKGPRVARSVRALLAGRRKERPAAE